MEQKDNRIKNPEYARYVASKSQLARRAIDLKLAMGVQLDTADEEDAKIKYYEEQAEREYIVDPTGNSTKWVILSKFLTDSSIALLSDKKNFKAHYGVIEKDEQNGVTEEVRRSIQSAVSGASRLLNRQLLKGHEPRTVSSRMDFIQIEGTSNVIINKKENTGILAFDMNTEDGQKAIQSIYEMFGVDIAARATADPVESGISQHDDGYSVMHFEVETNLPGILLEERVWNDFSLDDRKPFSQLFLKLAKKSA
jgi:hypothetical protein